MSEDLVGEAISLGKVSTTPMSQLVSFPGLPRLQLCLNHALNAAGIHNERIEHLWRDVFTGCTVLFYHLFNYMEATGCLDQDEELHLFCLHYIFIPRINSSLSQFMTMWNDHPLRTESNHSPNQLWMTWRHPDLQTVVRVSVLL